MPYKNLLQLDLYNSEYFEKLIKDFDFFIILFLRYLKYIKLNYI